MQSEKRYTKYLKAKDADDMDQLQQGLNTMIKQEPGNHSGLKEVAEKTEAMIILDINIIPSPTTLIRFLENEPNSINPQIEPELISAWISFLNKVSETQVHQELKTPQTKLKSNRNFSATKRKDSDSDGQTESDDDVKANDLDAVFKKLTSSRKAKSMTPKQSESEEHVYQSLKTFGKKLNENHIQAIVRYHVYQEEVIHMQRTAAEIIRRSVDAEFHSLFDLPHSAHTGSSTANVQGSMYLKALMVKYYDLRQGASATQYKRIEEIILGWQRRKGSIL